MGGGLSTLVGLGVDPTGSRMEVDAPPIQVAPRSSRWCPPPRAQERGGDDSDAVPSAIRCRTGRDDCRIHQVSAHSLAQPEEVLHVLVGHGPGEPHLQRSRRPSNSSRSLTVGEPDPPFGRLIGRSRSLTIRSAPECVSGILGRGRAGQEGPPGLGVCIHRPTHRIPDLRHSLPLVQEYRWICRPPVALHPVRLRHDIQRHEKTPTAETVGARLLPETAMVAAGLEPATSTM